jgi:Family of unknown function (DUF6481)
MKRSIDLGFAERRKAADEAKKKLLAKVAPALKTDTPEALAKRAEKAALAAERDVRRAERERVKRETAEREKIEAEARAKAEAEAAALAKIAEAEQEVREAAERKAERDKRYAARKARQR